MIYTLDKEKNESFDAEFLKQELEAAIGPGNWYVSTSGNSVTVDSITGNTELDFTMISKVVQDHFSNTSGWQEKKAMQEVKVLRRTAYQNEADPIAFKVIRGEATSEDYKAKVEEIRLRYPL